MRVMKRTLLPLLLLLSLLLTACGASTPIPSGAEPAVRRGGGSVADRLPPDGGIPAVAGDARRRLRGR